MSAEHCTDTSAKQFLTKYINMGELTKFPGISFQLAILLRKTKIFHHRENKHSLYIGIIIFPHIDNTNLQATINFKKKRINKRTKKKWGHPLIWPIIGEK